MTIPNLVQMKRTTANILANGIPPFLTEAASGVVMFLFNFIILRIPEHRRRSIQCDQRDFACGNLPVYRFITGNTAIN